MKQYQEMKDWEQDPAPVSGYTIDNKSIPPAPGNRDYNQMMSEVANTPHDPPPGPDDEQDAEILPAVEPPPPVVEPTVQIASSTQPAVMFAVTTQSVNDENLVENRVPVTANQAKSILSGVESARFNYPGNPDLVFGFGPRNVKQALEAAGQDPTLYALLVQDDLGNWSVDQTQMIPLMLEVINELTIRVIALEP
jgi:hypothetical protein